MPFQHQDLAAGRWFTLTIFEQLGNVGSEISRARKWKGVNAQYCQNAIFRALELIDLTLADPRWQKTGGLKEICRAREVVCDAFYGGKEYDSTLESLDKYFYYFAYAARAGR